MSIEAKLDELIASNGALAEATNKNTSILERVLAGQEAAMAKLEGTPTTRKPRQTAAAKEATETKAETAPTATAATHALLTAPNGETKKNAKGEDAPTGAYRASDFSRDQVKNEFIGWLGDTTDVDERKARAAFVAEIGQHFGVKQPFHPSEGLTDDDQRKQTLFFLRRKREGLKVDFSADYDFDGDPLADQSTDDGDDDGIDALG